MTIEQAENFFLSKIKAQAKKEGVPFTNSEQQLALLSLPNIANSTEEMQAVYESPDFSASLRALNNKVILLLRHAMQDDRASAPEVKKIRLGWFKWFTMPADWYDANAIVYNSDKFLSAIIQNFILGNPFE